MIVVWGVVALNAVDVAIRFGFAFGRAARDSSVASVALIMFSVIFSALLFAAISIAIRRSWKITPFLVTLLGLWALGEISNYGDALAYIVAAASLVMVVAVWLPSARRYAQVRRESSSNQASP